ncbi:MAG TPA: CbiX/SirB N-terminal domain-containing protein [Alphaproteobacteria bacterium]
MAEVPVSAAIGPAAFAEGRAEWRTSGLVLVGHGALAPAGATQALADHARALAKRGLFAAVAAGFLKGTPALESALDTMDLPRIYVVPCFMSEGHFVRTVLPGRLGITGPLAKRHGREIRYCGPRGTAPALADLVARRLEASASDERVAIETVDALIVGHGSSSNPASAAATSALARRVAERSAVRAVHTAYLDQAPALEDVVARLTGRTLVVAGLFAADGRHADEDVRRRLGFVAGAFRAVRPDGRRVLYTGAIGADPAVVELIVERIEAFDAARRGD